ncbi:MAG: putative Ig domain-containing protein [Myxococcota bacterium]
MKLWHASFSLLFVFSGCSCGTESPPASADAASTDGSSDGGVDNPPHVSTDQLPHGKVQVAYDQSLSATGGTTPYSWSIAAGTLPAGLQLSSDGHLRGTPTAPGPAAFTVKVTDANQATGTASLMITVDPADVPALSISTTALPTATIGSAYTATVAVMGGTPPYTWTVASGSLPPGLILASTSGRITGAPTGTAQLYTFTVAVTDSSQTPQMATAALGITVIAHSGALAITTAALPGGEIGQAYSADLAASGGTTPYRWNIASGMLPAGLSLDMSSGSISGTPTSTGSFTFSARVSDAALTPESAEQVFTLVIRPPVLTITTAALPSGEVGQPYGAVVAISGGAGPFVFTVLQGSLPDGLSLDGSTGAVSGTPSTAGTSNFTVQVADSFTPQNTAQHDYSISIAAITPTLLVTTSALPDAVVGASYQQILGAIGGTTPYSWSIASGALPPGLSLDSDGTLHGAATSSGTFSFRAAVSDTSAPSMQATVDLSLRVFSPLVLAAASLDGGEVGTAYAAALSASGGAPPYAFTIASGALPPGLSLDPGTGAISGTPSQLGVFGFEIGVSDAADPVNSASQAYSITITAPLSITTLSLADGLLGAAYSASINASGGTPAYAFRLSAGSLPDGLALNASTGEISGTAAAAGTFSFTVEVSDTSVPQQRATQALSIVVNAPPALTIVTNSLSGGVTGLAYSESLAAVGGIAPYRWSILSGQLPAGLALDPSSGLISGTPGAAATESFTVELSDSAAPSSVVTAMFSIAITDPLQITSTSLPNGVTGAAYSASVLASGGTPGYTWTITSGGLPAGLGLDRNTGAIFGIPTESGTFGLSLRAVDTSSPQQIASATLSLTIIPALEITTLSLPNGVDGTPYASSAAVSGGAAPYSWSITSGALPPGLSLNPADGSIDGTPNTTGVFSFTVGVSDSSTPVQQSAALGYQIAINGAGTLTINTTSLPPVLIGIAYAEPLGASGGTLPYGWSISSGSLPPGLSIDAQSGLISGTPTLAGTFAFEVEAADATVPSPQRANRSFSVVVIARLVLTTASLPGGVRNAPYSIALSADGGTTPYSWQQTAGALPAGLSLDAQSGVLSGTPTAVGTFTFRIEVTDVTAPAQVGFADLTIIVTEPLVVITSGFDTGITGSPFSGSLSATGGTAPFSWSLVGGALPAGLSLNPSTGVISGQPSTIGVFGFTVQATDASAPAQSATANLSIRVVGPLTITSSNLPRGTVGLAYSAQLSASGGMAPFAWGITGSLPNGLSLNPATGVISGVPTAAATTSFSVDLSDGSTPAQDTSAPISITISAPGSLAITTASLPDGVIGRAFSVALTAGGGSTPFVWSLVSGTLPNGLSLDAATGVISGSPARTGSFSFVVRVADNSSPQQSATRSLGITVASQLGITTAALQGAIVGQFYSTSLTGAGGLLPYAWSITAGSLPPGLSLDPVTGAITGIPTSIGNLAFTVQLGDGSLPQQLSSRQLRIAVAQTLSVTTMSLPSGTVGSAYSSSIQASGGRIPYGWSIVSGALPPGLSLSATTGLVSGTPTTAGTYNFTIRATDSGAPQQQATQPLSIQIFP